MDGWESGWETDCFAETDKRMRDARLGAANGWTEKQMGNGWMGKRTCRWMAARMEGGTETDGHSDIRVGH